MIKYLEKFIGSFFVTSAIVKQLTKLKIYLRTLWAIRQKYNRVASHETLGKAIGFEERFREIISDPINLLIQRVPNAGFLDENRNVILHNGLRVPVEGQHSYYGYFSDILVLNRGVHEPLEEYCFQELLNQLATDKKNHSMLELGAYWGHYSLWFSQRLPNAKCILVEPNTENLQCGKENFRLNKFSANFINEFVSSEEFTVDKFLLDENHEISELTLLHSDIQGYEVSMLENSFQSLSSGKIVYIMISTHSEDIHQKCLSIIENHSYIVEISSEPNFHTTSSDGFIFARRADMAKLITNDNILGRVDILNSTPNQIVNYLNKFKSST